MDIFAVPTKWDTFMIAAQEAQGAGIPVVATRTGGVAECVADGVSGYLCDHENDGQYIAAIERLIEDRALRQRMGRAGREHVSRNLNAGVWHNHLLDQIVATANGESVARLPGSMAENPRLETDRVSE
jgi:glycosyltransferase involved in cell wall biosynthesis